MSKRYNGWTNYETWNVKLWIDKDEASSRYWAGVAKDFLNYRHRLAEQLEHEITDAGPDLGASCYADLLGRALKQVNWLEIADSMIRDAKERVEA